MSMPIPLPSESAMLWAIALRVPIFTTVSLYRQSIARYRGTSRPIDSPARREKIRWHRTHAVRFDGKLELGADDGIWPHPSDAPLLPHAALPKHSLSVGCPYVVIICPVEQQFGARCQEICQLRIGHSVPDCDFRMRLSRVQVGRIVEPARCDCAYHSPRIVESTSADIVSRKISAYNPPANPARGANTLDCPN